MLAENLNHESAAREFLDSAEPVSSVVVSLAQGEAVSLSVNELEKLIGTDPDFSLRVLALANSAFYSQQYEVQELRGALVVLGAGTIQSLAASLMARGLVDSGDPLAEEIWTHSQAVGVAAHNLAELHGKIDPRLAYVAGLLHDVGLLVMLRVMPDQYRQALKHARKSSIDGHAQLGSQVAKLLGLAGTLCGAIYEHHHGLSEDAGIEGDIQATLMVAEAIANRADFALSTDQHSDDDQLPEAIARVELQPSDVETLVEYLPARIAALTQMVRT